jgi:hypothetical protein
MKVVFLPEVENYLFDLSEVLYKKEYFGFKESAINYVTDLVQDIKNSLSGKTKKVAPSYFDRYGKGMFYSVFRKSKTTQWYVFYTTYQRNGEVVFLVRYISNNHVISKHLG